MLANGLAAGLEQVRRNWGWYLVLGVLLIVLGAVAIGYPLTSSLATVVFFGWLLIISGVAQGIMAFQVRSWGGFFLHLLAGLLEVVVGALVLRTPLDATLVFTLLFAAYLLVGGLFRMIAALALGFPGSGWLALGGLISTLLGLALWWQWPSSGLWFIGTCIGVDLILHGASWIALAFTARRLPVLTPPQGTTTGPGGALAAGV
jgi:uncharacterized membrane protein HdeD (DUF308 family)